MSADIFYDARPLPGSPRADARRHRRDPARAPVFAIAGWPLKGWALAAVLWVAAQALALVLTRLPLDEGNLAAAGMRGIGTSFRALIVGIPLVAITVAERAVGIAAALLYALAFTLELAVSSSTFFGAEAKA